jgi:hypothetical protein
LQGVHFYPNTGANLLERFAEIARKKHGSSMAELTKYFEPQTLQSFFSQYLPRTPHSTQQIRCHDCNCSRSHARAP